MSAHQAIPHASTEQIMSTIISLSQTEEGRAYISRCRRVWESISRRIVDLDLDLSVFSGKDILELRSPGWKWLYLIHTSIPERYRTTSEADDRLFFLFLLLIQCSTVREALDCWIDACIDIAVFYWIGEEIARRSTRLPLTLNILLLVKFRGLEPERELLKPFNVIPFLHDPEKKREYVAQRALVFYEELEKIRCLPHDDFMANVLDAELEYLPKRLKDRKASLQRGPRWITKDRENETIIMPPSPRKKNRPKYRSAPEEPPEQVVTIRKRPPVFPFEYIKSEERLPTRHQAQQLEKAFGPKAPDILEIILNPEVWGTEGTESGQVIRPPSQAEIARQVGLTDRQVRKYLKKIESRPDELIEIFGFDLNPRKRHK